MIFLPRLVSRLAYHSALTVTLAVCAPLAQAQASDTKAPTVLARGPANLVVSSNDILSELKTAPEADRKAFLARPNGVEQLADSLLTRRALATDAVREGLDKDPVVVAAIAIARDRILSVARLARIDAQNTPSDADLDTQARALYQANTVKYSKPARTRARHILIENQGPESLQKANELLAQLRSGASFESLAKANSSDTSTAARGGDLGFFTSAQVVAPFADAVNALDKPGDVSEPVLSQFGYHLIQLEERRDEGIPPYEEIREQLVSETRANILNEGRLRMAENLKKNFTFDSVAIEAFVKAEKTK